MPFVSLRAQFLTRVYIMCTCASVRLIFQAPCLVSCVCVCFQEVPLETPRGQKFGNEVASSDDGSDAAVLDNATHQQETVS
eukprot:6474096-Amphidinium_carterae.1